MDIHTPKTMRRSTRLRVEIPASVTSLDRKRPFAEPCVLLVVSAQGCGLRSAQALPVETPIMIYGLPNGCSVTGRVANCLPLGADGKHFLIGVSLHTHGNVWGITDAPEDWSMADARDPAPRHAYGGAPSLAIQKTSWPYNLFAKGAEAHPGRK